MDNFPQFPPHDETPSMIDEANELLAWFGLITAVWVLSLVAVIYLVAGGGESFASYIHGVLLGIVIGSGLILSAITRKAARTKGPGA